MATPEEQILQAIALASDHTLQGQEIHSQAIAFLDKVRSENEQSWRPALSLFVATNGDGSRRFSDTIRLFATNIIADFLESRNHKHKLGDDEFALLKEQLMGYLRSEYLYGPAEANAYFIRNKFSWVLTLLCLDTYETQWPEFFDDICALIFPSPESGLQSLNPHVSIFFFKLLMEISSEIADQIMKNARTYNAERVGRDSRIRDLVREKDAPKINNAVLTIVADAKQRIDQMRANNVVDKANFMEEIADLGMRAFASYIPWVDINLTVTPDTISLIFSLLSDPSLNIRLATCTVINRIVNKGLKVSSDKVKLLQVLSLGPVLDQLEQKTSLTTDDPIQSFRDALARVTNSLGEQLVVLCSDGSLPPDDAQAAGEMLAELMPIALRFLKDPYDDTSITVFPLINEILNSYKKAKQASPRTYMTPEKHEFLRNTLDILIEKLKWDDSDDPDDMDQDDVMVFENMRKDIRKAIDAIWALDSDLVTNAISERAQVILDSYESGNMVNWDVAELAIYLVYIYGELGGKDRGKGRLAFCMAPTNIPKEERKLIDYSAYPLTPQGETMQALFFETVTRYADFFKVRKEYILPALEAFLDARGVHHPLPAVRKRIFYLFFRFVQALRIDVEVQHVPPILQAIQDILTVDVEIPEDMEDDAETRLTADEYLAEVLKTPAMFDSQLYMFEASGALVSTLFSMPEIQAASLQTVTKPLLERLSTCLQTPLTGTPVDYRNILTVHHCIQALGSIPKGFPEFPSPIPAEYIMPPIAEFRQMSEAILISLDMMGGFRIVREAARFSFGRIIYAAGPTITEYIPRLMVSLLSHFETSEFVEFIGFISHMTHKLQGDLRDVLDKVLAPLSTHVTTTLTQPITGTDDKVARLDTKKAYLNFLNTIMASNLGLVLVSQTNVTNLEPFLETILQMASDTSDPLNQKLALIFLTKFISLFGYAALPVETNGTSASGIILVPGIEQFIYQRVLVVAFSIPFRPEFNVKDGQSIAALNEISNLLQTIVKVRGDEALSYISTVFLPSQNFPPEVSLELANNMRTMDKRNFQKYLVESVKAVRPS